MKITLRIRTQRENPTLSEMLGETASPYYLADVCGPAHTPGGARKRLTLPGKIGSGRDRDELIRSAKEHLMGFGFAEDDIVVESIREHEMA